MEQALEMREQNQSRGILGYKCSRCGQPKRGHLCAALSSHALEGEALVWKSAELGAYATQCIKAARLAALLHSRPKQRPRPQTPC